MPYMYFTAYIAKKKKMKSNKGVFFPDIHFEKLDRNIEWSRKLMSEILHYFKEHLL